MVAIQKMMSNRNGVRSRPISRPLHTSREDDDDGFEGYELDYTRTTATLAGIAETM